MSSNPVMRGDGILVEDSSGEVETAWVVMITESSHGNKAITANVATRRAAQPLDYDGVGFFHFKVPYPNFEGGTTAGGAIKGRRYALPSEESEFRDYLERKRKWKVAGGETAGSGGPEGGTFEAGVDDAGNVGESQPSGPQIPPGGPFPGGRKAESERDKAIDQHGNADGFVTNKEERIYKKEVEKKG